MYNPMLDSLYGIEIRRIRLSPVYEIKHLNIVNIQVESARL